MASAFGEMAMAVELAESVRILRQQVAIEEHNLEAAKDVFHHVTDEHQHHLARQAALEDAVAKRCAVIEAQKRAIAHVQAEIAAEMQRAVGETEAYYEKITGVLAAALALENSTDRTAEQSLHELCVRNEKHSALLDAQLTTLQAAVH